MNLDIDNWKPFVTKKLFPVLRPGKANQQLLDEGNDCFYIGAKKDDNGVMLHCALDNELIQKGNCIIFICNGQGSVGYANYMDIDFIGTTDIIAGYNDNLNPLVGNFLATVYSLERPKYSFGRKWKTHLEDTEIKLPAKKNEDGSFYFDSLFTYSDQGFVPDWHYMEDYIKSLHYKPISTQNERNDSTVSVNGWKEFRLKDVFTLKGGFYNKKPEHSSEGTFPFLGSTENNNGVTEYYNLDDIFVWDKVGGQDNTFDKKIFDGNCIAVTVNGSVCNAFYQKEKFTCSHDITALYLIGHDMNQYIALFLCTIIMMDKYRWSYGRKPHDVKKFGQSLIKLPVDSDGNPDWQYMEDYIKNLPYGDRI